MYMYMYVYTANTNSDRWKQKKLYADIVITIDRLILQTVQ